jgi:hypothetical protein
MECKTGIGLKPNNLIWLSLFWYNTNLVPNFGSKTIVNWPLAICSSLNLSGKIEKFISFYPSTRSKHYGTTKRLSRFSSNSKFGQHGACIYLQMWNRSERIPKQENRLKAQLWTCSRLNLRISFALLMLLSVKTVRVFSWKGLSIDWVFKFHLVFGR